METTIDRASYRRSNLKSEVKVKKPKNFTRIFFNEIIIAMAILIGILLIKIFHLTGATSWLQTTIDSGIPYEILVEKTAKKYNELVDGLILYTNSNGLNIDDINNGISGDLEVDAEIDDISQKTEIYNASTIVYETAVEGVNQLSEDAKIIKEKYKLIVPVNGTITSSFGCRVDDNPIVSSYHAGLDIAANNGTTIVASHDGEIIEAGTIGTYGKCIMIKQDNLTTVYAHCSKINVKKGTQIKKGEKIGEVGMTGNATGPHVHFEIRYDGRYVNPEDVI